MSKGKLFVISGPSGVGKGTLVDLLKDAKDNVWVSISATTRLPREGEVNGVNYQFLSDSQFEALIDEDGFLEWAEYAGNKYGTPIAPIQNNLEDGCDVILEIEVQGALQVKDKFPDARLIFIEPPSMDELASRLRGRGTESEEVIQRRLDTAKLELNRKMEYDTSIVNNDLEQALNEIVRYMEES